MSWKEPSERHSDAMIEAIEKASHRIATAIAEGFKHMADAQTKALADLNLSLTNISDAIAAEIAALQTALSNSGQPDDSGEIEQAVTNLNNLAGSLKASIPTKAPIAPVLTTLSPTSGPAAGGTSVTLSGTGFTGATGVAVGGVAAASLSVVSDTQITLVTPVGFAGPAPVIVTTPAGSSPAASNVFAYV